MEPAERETVYGQDEYYWGREPNELARRTLEWADRLGLEGPVVDLGAGEGRDAVFFAERGFESYAVDVSPAGLAKAERLAAERGVEISTLEADLNTFELPEPAGIVYSAGAVQYIRPGERRRQFERFRNATRPGGLHAVFAFVDHPEIPRPPDWTASEYFYEPGELAEYYPDWTVRDLDSVRFTDDSGGRSHEHAAEILVARRPTG